ncbi:diguanylate cyclase [Cochlodiniinecator piscidefendens]|uniref:diguanylate cyclase n=1 Tax=Cochlodiniinecator piscidefendens TaxID=2715756 RepID=UPI0014098AAE|nr:diguanylate cyclase [Cochlodiniinecator piscidefendens]
MAATKSKTKTLTKWDEDVAETDLTMDVLNSMEQGILVWSDGGVCRMHNQRILSMLELSPEAIYPGITRTEFLEAAAARGELDKEAVETAQARFARRAPFSFDRKMPSGRTVTTNARPLRGGGFVVTFSDVSETRRNADDLAKAKAKAEAAELKALKTLAAEQAWRNEARLLSDLDEWLQCCKSLSELFEILGSFMTKLLPETEGELYIYSNSRDVLDGACAWSGSQMHDHILPDSCWALRRGRHYHYNAQEVSFSCDHVKEQSGVQDVENYLCIPIIAHGDTVGLMHVRFSSETSANMNESARRFALQCGEHISLAIANVRLRDELHDQSTRDPLTGLYNRRFFLEALRNELSMAERRKQKVGILSFDADKFKAFNDNHGHDAGDMVLRAIGEKLNELFCNGQIPCRFGGEEFTVLLPGTDLEQAKVAGEALRAAVEEVKIRYGSGLLPRVTISVGVSSYPEHGILPQDLLNAADGALYAAKDAGRNCVRVASNSHEE